MITTLYPIIDNWGYYGNTINRNEEPLLELRNPGTKEIVLKFPIEDIEKDIIITSVKFRIYMCNSGQQSSSYSGYFGLLSPEYSPRNLNELLCWTSTMFVNANPYVSIYLGNSIGWKEVDITSLVQLIVDKQRENSGFSISCAQVGYDMLRPDRV